MKRNKLKIQKNGITKSTASTIGIATTLLFSVLLTGLITNLVLNGHLSEKLTKGVVFAIRTISVIVGALIGGSLFKRDYLVLIGIIASGYLVLLIGTGIVFFNGSFENFLPGIISVPAGGVLAFLILQATRGNRNKHKKITI